MWSLAREGTPSGTPWCCPRAKTSTRWTPRASPPRPPSSLLAWSWSGRALSLTMLEQPSTPLFTALSFCCQPGQACLLPRGMIGFCMMHHLVRDRRAHARATERLCAPGKLWQPVREVPWDPSSCSFWMSWRYLAIWSQITGCRMLACYWATSFNYRHSAAGSHIKAHTAKTLQRSDKHSRMLRNCTCPPCHTVPQ